MIDSQSGFGDARAISRIVSVFYRVAATGFFTTLALHALTFLPIDLRNARPIFFLLFFGIFFVWLPTVLVAIVNQRQAGGRFSWNQAVRNAPTWMKVLCLALVLYVPFNFFYSGLVLNQGGGPHEENGQYVLSSHGEVIRELSEQEYEQAVTYELRMVSGHPLIFYSVGMAVLYSKKREYEK